LPAAPLEFLVNVVRDKLMTMSTMGLLACRRRLFLKFTAAKYQ